MELIGDNLFQMASQLKQAYHKSGSKADWVEIESILKSAGNDVVCDERFRCAVKRYEKKKGILHSKNHFIDSFLEPEPEEMGDVYRFQLAGVEMKKEKVKLQDIKNQLQKTIRETARVESLQDIVREEIKNITPYKPLNIPTPKFNKSTNEMLIGLNDIHFGVGIDNNWNVYNPDVAKKRLEQYLIEIFDIQKLHGINKCVVISGGDLISGSIHLTIQLANKENVVKQVMGVSELIAWFLSELCRMFGEVGFASVAGNHSRLAIKENSPKDERLDDMIPWYVEARLQNFNNFKIVGDKIDNTINLVEIAGLQYAAVHGDNDKLPGILRLIEMLPKKVYGIYTGHLHHNTSNYVQGYKVIMSGSLMGMDDFCVEKRIFGKPQQIVCICNNKGILCTYDVSFD